MKSTIGLGRDACDEFEDDCLVKQVLTINVGTGDLGGVWRRRRWIDYVLVSSMDRNLTVAMCDSLVGQSIG